MASDQQLSAALSGLAQTLTAEFPVQGIIDRLVEIVAALLPETAAGVTIFSPEGGPRYVAASGDDALRLERLQSDPGEGPGVRSYLTGEPVAAPDLRNEDRFGQFVPQAVLGGVQAIFSFPLRVGDDRLGALDLYRNTPGELSGDSVATAETLAQVVAIYLLNAQIHADLRDASERSRQASLHDPLTGLPNRVLILERLEHAFARGKRSGKISAVFFVDLDHFKAVNDTYGHRAGDEVLVAVAGRLAAILRPGDSSARLSGDEFVVLCEDLDDPSQADGIVARIDAALATPYVLSDGNAVDLTASVGIAFTGRESDAPDRLLHDADQAMYEVKHRSRHHKRVIDLRSPDLSAHDPGLGPDLADALGNNELSLSYQPIVDSTDSRLIGAEALLRWAHPQRGSVPANVVVPLAERTGLIVEIGRWVLERAWADRGRWPARPGPEPRIDLAVSVNVSARELMGGGYVDAVAAVVGATAGADPGLLTLEVSESVFAHDPQRALVVLHDLKDLGVILALDGFGTGYSSLQYLKRFPFDVIKVDRVFVSDLGDDPASTAIMAAVVQLAHTLRMTVVAEGVETATQHAEATRLGCDLCQGYYFARPMNDGALETMLGQSAGTDPPVLDPAA